MKVFKEIFWQIQLLLKRFRFGFTQNVSIEIQKQAPALPMEMAPAVSCDKCCPPAVWASYSAPAHTEQTGDYGNTTQSKFWKR